jgi:hypothetical protein
MLFNDLVKLARFLIAGPHISFSSNFGKEMNGRIRKFKLQKAYSIRIRIKF